MRRHGTMTADDGGGGRTDLWDHVGASTLTVEGAGVASKLQWRGFLRTASGCATAARDGGRML